MQDNVPLSCIFGSALSKLDPAGSYLAMLFASIYIQNHVVRYSSPTFWLSHLKWNIKSAILVCQVYNKPKSKHAAGKNGSASPIKIFSDEFSVNKEKDKEEKNNMPNQLIEFEEEENIFDDDFSDEEAPSLWEIIKRLSNLSLPMAASYTFSFQVVLIILLLNLQSDDEDDVAATNLSSALMNAFVVMGLSPLYSMGIIASMKIGEINILAKEVESRDEEHENSLLIEDDVRFQVARNQLTNLNRNGWLLSAALAPPVMAGMIWSAPLLSEVFGQDEIIAEKVQEFLRPYSLSVPAIFMRLCTEQMLFSFSKTKPTMVIGLIDFALGAGLSTWLEFGGLGVPALGTLGVALGCVAESYLTTILFNLYLAHHSTFKHYPFFHFFRSFKGNFSELRKLLHLGLPTSASVITAMGASALTALLAGQIGTLENASWAFITAFSSFIFIFSGAFAAGNAQELARQLGSEKIRETSCVGRYGLLTTLGYILPPAIIVSLDPKLVMILFGNKDGEIESELATAMPIAAIGIVTSAGAFNLLQQFRTLGRPYHSTLIYMTSLLSGVAGSYFLGLKTPMELNGVATGYALGSAAGFGMLGVWWVHRTRPSKIQADILKTREKKEQNTFSFSNSFKGCFFSRVTEQEPEREAELQPLIETKNWSALDLIRANASPPSFYSPSV